MTASHPEDLTFAKPKLFHAPERKVIQALMTQFMNTGRAVSLVHSVKRLYNICFSNILFCALGKKILPDGGMGCSKG